MKSLSLILIVGLAAGPGCGDKKDNAPAKTDKGTSGKSGKASNASGAGGPFGAWSAADAARRFEGAWLCPAGARGMWEAWEIEGDKVKVFDGKAETEQAFAVTSPCTASLTKTEGRIKSSRIPQFVWDGDKLVMFTDVGFIKDGMAVACISNKVYTLVDGTCTEHSERFGQWSQKPAECSLSDAAFELAGNRGTTVPRKGDVLIGSAPLECEKLADFETAKARLTEK